MPCIFCRFDAGVAEQAFFCGRCGKAQVESVILKHRTTANYDPGDFTWRPWREKINVVETSKFDKEYAAMKYEAKQSKQKQQKLEAFVNDQPWRPVGALKRPKLQRKRQKDPNVIKPEEGPAADEAAIAADAEADAISKHYLKFLGHPFMKDERYYKPRKEGLLIEEAAEDAKEEVIKSYQKTSPLSIYECTWIQMKCPVVCHVGLSETMIGLKRTHYLRIGIMLDDMIEPGDSKSTDPFDTLKIHLHNTLLNESGRRKEKPILVPRGELVSLDMLKNEIASISVPSNIAWVDLYAITPNEPYIIKHTDSLFSYVASRVKFENKKIFGLFDQINTINTRTQYDRTVLVSSYNLRPKPDDVINLLCDSYLSIKNGFEDDKVLYLDKNLYTVSKKIRLGKLHFMKFLYCQVRIWIKFTQERWNESILGPKSGGVASQRGGRNVSDIDDMLMVPTECCSVVLQIIPLRNDFSIRPKILVLTRKSVEEVCKIPNLDNYIRSGKRAVMGILSDLCSLICFQMTQRGVVVTMSCAVAELDIIEDYFEGDLDPDAGIAAGLLDAGELDSPTQSRPNTSDFSSSRSSISGGGSLRRREYESARRHDASIKLQSVARRYIARSFFINKWNTIYRSYDIMVKKKAMYTKNVASRPYTLVDAHSCPVHRDLKCHCVCATMKVDEDKDTAGISIDVVCEFEAVERNDAEEEGGGSFDYEDDDWIIFVSLVETRNQMSTSMVIESRDVWDLMSFMFDDIVNNNSLVVDSFLHHHKFKVSSSHIAKFNESKEKIIAQAAVIQEKDTIFSIKDMLILPGVNFAVSVFVVRGMDIFLSRVGHSFMARYKRSDDLDRFLLLRNGDEGMDDGSIIAL